MKPHIAKMLRDTWFYVHIGHITYDVNHPLNMRQNRLALVLLQREKAYRTRESHNRTSRRLISGKRIGRPRWVLRTRGES